MFVELLITASLYFPIKILKDQQMKVCAYKTLAKFTVNCPSLDRKNLILISTKRYKFDRAL